MPLIFVNQGLFSNRSWDYHRQWWFSIGGAFSGGYGTPTYGRKLTFSAGLSILAAVVLADSNFTDAHPRESDRGLSSGCYWTAAAAVIDVTPSEHRQKRLHSWL